MGYTVHGILQAKPRCPALQADSLLAEPQGNPPKPGLFITDQLQRLHKPLGILGKFLCAAVFFFGKAPELTSNLKKSKNICNQRIRIGVLELEYEAMCN